jgi:hypothetical protein
MAAASACDGGDDTVRPYPGVETAGRSGRGGSAGAAGTTGQAGQSGGAAGSSGGGQTSGGGATASAGTGGAAGAAGTNNAAGSAGATAGSSGAAGTGGVCAPGLGAGIDEARAVFVAKDGSATGDGSKDNPLVDVQAGLDIALAKGGGTVIVAAGTYAESLVFVAQVGAVPVVVRGGYVRDTSGFHDSCEPTGAPSTVLASPTSVGVTFTNVTNDSGLERVRVTTTTPKTSGASPNGAPGESAIGVVVRGANSKVRVLASVIEPADASSATAATPPAVAGTTACLGVGATCTTGADGMPAASTVGAATAGTFAVDGSYLPGGGSTGGKGEPGANGFAGEAAVVVKIAGACTKSPVCSIISTCTTTQKSVPGAPGSCGCGGEGGLPGAAGREGGASVGVLVAGAGATVRLDGSSVRAGRGGDGSPGGEGGEGGLPTSGAEGELVTAKGIACASSSAPCAAMCPVTNVTKPVPGGAAGGKGGKGGKGSAGSGGPGGPSCGLVLVGGATSAQDAATLLMPGNAGKGAGTAGPGKVGSTCTF